MTSRTSRSSAACGIWPATSPSTARSSLLGTQALIGHAGPHAIAAYRGGVPVSAGRLLAQAAALARSLPAGPTAFVNAAADRQRFAVALLAGLMAGKVSLLPATHTPEMIRRLADETADLFCVTDDPACPIGLPQVRLFDALEEGLPWPPPQRPQGARFAQLYTSGSTGRPMPHLKTWGRMVAGARACAQQLGLDGRPHVFVATVPAQHMFGLESSVLLPLVSGNALCAERPFYPADVCEALARVPAPRVLVSTPVHLRALLSADVTLPALTLVLSATAPLTQQEAQQVEQRFGTRLMEIYGSTETGQMAQRRTAVASKWTPYPGVRLMQVDGTSWAEGGHLEQPTPLNDVLELTPDGDFLLHGRVADLVNIAGKRSSLSYLSHQLCSIHGVLDGAFFHPEDVLPSRTGVTRVAAIAAAPGLSASGLLDELRRRIDPVFLPRPLLLVPKLPRNSTGKLPLTELQQLARLQPRLAARCVESAHDAHLP